MRNVLIGALKGTSFGERVKAYASHVESVREAS